MLGPDFDVKLKELAQKLQRLPKGPAEYGEQSLKELSTDIADLINGINPLLGNKFRPFYHHIGCRIAVQNIEVETVHHNQTCDHLYNHLVNVPIHAIVGLRFFLEGSKGNGLGDIVEHVEIELRQLQYEIRYTYAPQKIKEFQKEYKNTLLREEAGELLDLVATSMQRKIGERIDKIILG